jgi:CRP-like cAMP-binding protein
MSSVANRLVEGLPRKARNELLAMCEPVELSLGEVLYRRDLPARHIYFPTGGTLSLWSPPGDLPVLEIAMVGNEGMLGAHLALGVRTSATFAEVRGAGSAWRMAAAHFKAELTRNAPLERSIHRYLHVTILQYVSMARCSRFHNLDQRLARWLLMTHDRARTDTFSVTQELMASMLGVRRVGITAAASALQRRGVIEYARGEVTILNRASLEAAACSCYAADRRSYSKFLS